MNNEEFSSEEEGREFAESYDRNLTIGSNDTIQKEVSEALKDTQGVEIHVNNGIVILTGAVDSEDLRVSAEQKIQSIPGVHEVINELTVKRLN